YIFNVNTRGFAPLKAKVKDIVNKILAKRGIKLVSKNWVDRFVARKKRLKIAFNYIKDI
ncbi:hypothetical protein BU23DRAFT_458080, partial [Bimuria novae-zelandiae CBS 107.79]